MPPPENGPRPASRYSDPVIEALRKNVDKTLIETNLRLTHEERLLQLEELQRFAEELRRAGREAKKKAGPEEEAAGSSGDHDGD